METQPKKHYTHICMPVQIAIDLMAKGKQPFTGESQTKILRELTRRRAEGIKYMTGCDNEDKEGRCQGHEGEPER